MGGALDLQHSFSLYYADLLPHTFTQQWKIFSRLSALILLSLMNCLLLTLMKMSTILAPSFCGLNLVLNSRSKYSRQAAPMIIQRSMILRQNLKCKTSNQLHNIVATRLPHFKDNNHSLHQGQVVQNWVKITQG